MSIAPVSPPESGWLSTTPATDTLLRAFLLSQVELNGMLAASFRGGRHDVHEDVGMSDARSAVAYLNQAVLLRPVLETSDPLLDRVDGFLEHAPGPATLLSAWPTPDLAGRGWTLVGCPAFVVRPAGAKPFPDPPPAVATTVARDVDELARAERVLVEGYPLPAAAAGPAGSLLPPALLASPLRVRVAHLDDAPAGVACSLASNGVLNLCMAATLVTARRRGVWRALVAARCADHPDLPAAAFTSDDSRPGFVRLGFLAVTRFTLLRRQA